VFNLLARTCMGYFWLAVARFRSPVNRLHTSLESSWTLFHAPVTHRHTAHVVGLANCNCMAHWLHRSIKFALTVQIGLHEVAGTHYRARMQRGREEGRKGIG
jgi:hypothetical protein